MTPLVRGMGLSDSKVVWRIALAKLAEIRQAYAEHAEYVKGYEGTKYRPQRCVHGANLWVDHDIPCGRCEEGESHFDYLIHGAQALGDAMALMSEVHKRRAMVLDLFAMDAPLHPDLFSWASAPVSEWSN